MPTKKSLPTASLASKNRIVLVLQGGGALGAYQAGVYQALNEHALRPDWVVGTSIGAINAALIAGNPPERRLARIREFWDRIAHADTFDLKHVADPARQLNTWYATIDILVRGIRGFFSPRLLNPFAMGLPVEADAASFYDTQELAATLAELVDFDYLNQNKTTRLTVNAVQITSGELVCFDSAHQTIGIEHIMASCALPPGFPPIRVDGNLYWDGGLYSNTPLETVLDDRPVVNTLCFMVDLWSATGPEPTTFDQVETRRKDVMFASRSKRQIQDYLALHEWQRIAQELFAQLPPEAQRESNLKERLQTDSESLIQIVRLMYRGQDWHMSAKDVNFSKGSVEWRWDQGYRDTAQAIQKASWKKVTQDHAGLILYEVEQ